MVVANHPERRVQSDALGHHLHRIGVDPRRWLLDRREDFDEVLHVLRVADDQLEALVGAIVVVFAAVEGGGMAAVDRLNQVLDGEAVLQAR